MPTLRLASPKLLSKPGIFIAIEGNATLVKDREMFKKHWVSDLESGNVTIP